MLIKKLSAAALVLLLLVIAPVRVWATSPEVDAIASELICQCGCNAVLSNCTHGECMVRDGMTQSIEAQLTQGKSQVQIIQTFVAQYGEAVLSSPPKKGFNLTAWIAPFVAIIAGGVVIYIAIKRWVRRGGSAVPEPAPAVAAKTAEDDSLYLREIEKDLKNFGERGYR